MNIIILSIRAHGGEDDVFVFHNDGHRFVESNKPDEAREWLNPFIYRWVEDNEFTPMHENERWFCKIEQTMTITDPENHIIS